MARWLMDVQRTMAKYGVPNFVMKKLTLSFSFQERDSSSGATSDLPDLESIETRSENLFDEAQAMEANQTEGLNSHPKLETFCDAVNVTEEDKTASQEDKQTNQEAKGQLIEEISTNNDPVEEIPISKAVNSLPKVETSCSAVNVTVEDTVTSHDDQQTNTCKDKEIMKRDKTTVDMNIEEIPILRPSKKFDRGIFSLNDRVSTTEKTSAFLLSDSQEGKLMLCIFDCLLCHVEIVFRIYWSIDLFKEKGSPRNRKSFLFVNLRL